MRLLAVRAVDVLSFESLELKFGPSLTVIAGPNGSGKTSIGRLIDIVHLAVRSCVTGDWNEQTERYGLAGRYGAINWHVELDLELNKSDELSLVRDFARTALATMVAANEHQKLALYERSLVPDLGATAVFGSGTLSVRYDGTRLRPWIVRWAPKEVEGVSASLNNLTLGPDSVPDDGPTGNLASFLQATSGPVSNAGLSDAVSKVTLLEIIQVIRIDLRASPTGMTSEPPALRNLLRRLGKPVDTRTIVSWPVVLDHLLSAALLITNNHRQASDARIAVEKLGQLPDLASGRGMALSLWQDKNGGPCDRGRFDREVSIFKRLTGADLDVQAQPAEASLTLLPVLIDTDRQVDIPLTHAGAGHEEAALLSVLLSRQLDCLVLDEPATNLSAVAQRRLLSELRNRDGQTILITHSAHLVPANEPNDLKAVVRLSRKDTATIVHQPSQIAVIPRLRTLLRVADIRDLLFAAGVLLVEGVTELEALEVWLADPGDNLPTPEEAHVVILDVGGEQGFNSYTALLKQLGVPWSILADGPAFRQHKLGRIDGAPDAPTHAETFADALHRWRPTGVFSLATDFYDDGSKGGEIEAFFLSVDPDVLNRLGRSNKVRTGAAFAEAVPTPPEVTTLWANVLRHLELFQPRMTS